MKFAPSCAAASAVAFIGCAVPLSDAFAIAPAAFVSSSAAASQQQQQRTAGSSSTELYISSWGAGGPPHRQKKEDEPDPAVKIQAYLKAPEPVPARDSIDGTCLVSGFVRSKERTDQTVFDLLNHEDSAFRFEKIVAFVDDEKFARKRLIGRHARYTGLLDKLDFIQAGEPGALPTAEQLDGVKSWVASVGNDVDAVKKIADLVKSSSSVENVSILLTDASAVSTPEAALDAIQSLEADGKSFSVIAVGSVKETPEGSVPYEMHDLGTANGTIASNATFSRDESLRLVTELLGLESGKDKALTFNEVTDVNQTEYKLIKALREAGYTRPQEIDHMLTKGAAAYLEACEDWKHRSPKRSSDEDWMVREEEKLELETKEAIERAEKDKEAARKDESEEIAREWAKREFFRKGMAGEIIDMTEEEYIESIWDRALFEGDLKWRQINGKSTDADAEFEDFKTKQEKKKQAMLEKAKASLAELLDEEEDVVGAGKKDSGDEE